MGSVAAVTLSTLTTVSYNLILRSPERRPCNSGLDEKTCPVCRSPRYCREEFSWALLCLWLVEWPVYFLSGGAEGTTPLRVGIPAAVSHFRAPCFLGSAGLKDMGCQSHFKGPVFRKRRTVLWYWHEYFIIISALVPLACWEVKCSPRSTVNVQTCFLSLVSSYFFLFFFSAGFQVKLPT